MFLRSTRWAASVLELGLLAATVVAQPPAGPAIALHVVDLLARTGRERVPANLFEDSRCG